MRRTLAVVLAVGVLAASCSSGGDDNPTVVRADQESSTADSVDDGNSQSGDTSGDQSSSSSAAPADGVVPLPGLLDTSDDPIPLDDSVRTGTLPNGLTYYVRSNDNPGGKAELRLAINAGSVNEIGPSTGVAHFVEHMLFNGTEKFPKNELIEVLRGFGASFGADINARTTTDETVYELSVPNDDESLSTGLTVLEQWLSHATFDPDQVVSERGVVLDEWRVSTQSASGRLLDVAEDLYYSDSAYAGRFPIGTDTSISAMEAVELRDFYDAWYRPDNAAIVVVGDIDVDDTIKQIEALFGPAVARSDAMPERPDTSFPIDTEPNFGLHSDPDQTTVDVEVTLPLPGDTGIGTASLRAALIDQMIYDALVRRLDQDVSAGTAPFDEILPGGNGFVRSYDAPALYSFTDPERVGDTLQALLDEYQRANRFGFTADEVDVVKEAVRAGYDSRYDGRDSTQDVAWAGQYVSHFLMGTAYPTIEVEHEVATSIIDGVTPEALDLRFRARWTNSAPHVIISTPASETVLTEDEVLAMIAGLADRDLTPREGLGDLPDALMGRPAVVEASSNESILSTGDPYFDPLVLTFPNGVTVILNSDKIVEGQVEMQASSPGGLSLVADADVVDGHYASQIVMGSGVDRFNSSELSQIIAGRDVSLDAWSTPYIDNFAGTAATTDLEVLFQLIHLYVTKPRVDQVALRQVQQFDGPLVADPTTDPDVAGEDALLDARYPGEPRYASLPTPEDFATLDLEGAKRVWLERYGDATDWTFVFSGDFDMDEVIDFAGSYLATLPASGTPEEWVAVGGPPPEGVVEVSVSAGTGDTATVSMLFTSPISEVDAVVRDTADVASQVVSARLTDVIREELGETYSPGAFSFITTDPDPVIETYVSVSGSPDRVGAITDLVIGELADLAANGPSDNEFENAYAQIDEQYGFINNSQIISVLLNDELYATNDLDDYLDQYSALESVTARIVQEYIANHMPTDRNIQVTVIPR
jgi:zinc protease